MMFVIKPIRQESRKVSDVESPDSYAWYSGPWYPVDKLRNALHRKDSRNRLGSLEYLGSSDYWVDSMDVFVKEVLFGLSHVRTKKHTPCATEVEFSSEYHDPSDDGVDMGSLLILKYKVPSPINIIIRVVYSVRRIDISDCLADFKCVAHSDFNKRSIKTSDDDPTAVGMGDENAYTLGTTWNIRGSVNADYPVAIADWIR